MAEIDERYGHIIAGIAIHTETSVKSGTVAVHLISGFPLNGRFGMAQSLGLTFPLRSHTITKQCTQCRLRRNKAYFSKQK
jgi:hypothetical protein